MRGGERKILKRSFPLPIQWRGMLHKAPWGHRAPWGLLDPEIHLNRQLHTASSGVRNEALLRDTLDMGRWRAPASTTNME